MSSTSFETPKKAKLIPKPEHSKLLYQSKSIGLDNAWELWIKEKSTAVLCIRVQRVKGGETLSEAIGKGDGKEKKTYLPGYDQKFPNEGKDMMLHHSFPPYLYLLNQE